MKDLMKPRYLRHIECGFVLKVDTLLFDKVLFVGHTVWQPIEWYVNATESEYQTFLTSKNSL